MKKFHISDVLSITTGKMLSSRGIEGIYDILNYMTNDSIYTHQIPRAMQQCEPYLLKQFPQIKNVNADNVDADNYNEWMDEQINTFGKCFMVIPLPEGVYEQINPIQELFNMMDSKK